MHGCDSNSVCFIEARLGVPGGDYEGTSRKALLSIKFLVQQEIQRLRAARFFFDVVFLSILSCHAVRKAPANTSALALARRMCVIPILPHPPGIGRKTSGNSRTKSACCSSVSFKLPSLGLGTQAWQKSCRGRENQARPYANSPPLLRSSEQSCGNQLQSPSLLQ